MKHLWSAFEEVHKIIDKSNNIAVVSHRNPDGDTVGSNCALSEILTKQLGKNTVSVCIDPIPKSLLFINHPFKHKIREDTDLLIAVDCSSEDQVALGNLSKMKIPIINIDHHPTNSKFGKLNIIEAQAASTTEIIFNFLKFLDSDFTPSIATCLLTGLYTDTGSFMHSNTTPASYKMASYLIRNGAKMQSIINNLFKNQSIDQLHLWGRVLGRVKLNENGNVVSKITENDFLNTNTSPNDLSGVINYLNSVPAGNMSILIAEDRKGNIKGSVRTSQSDLDVSEVCKKFGGGGHKKAAGFTIPGKIVGEEVWKIHG